MLQRRPVFWKSNGQVLSLPAARSANVSAAHDAHAVAPWARHDRGLDGVKVLAHKSQLQCR
jgi:hypothetical protein